MNPCLLKLGADDKKLNSSSSQVRHVQSFGFGVLSFLLIHLLGFLGFFLMGFWGVLIVMSFTYISRS